MTTRFTRGVPGAGDTANPTAALQSRSVVRTIVKPHRHGYALIVI
jgi:hypothetical protein